MGLQNGHGNMGLVPFFDRRGGGHSQELSSVVHVNKTIYFSKC